MADPSPLPRISVVVPSYNQGRFLPECLASLFRQEYPDLEVIVMDGGSTDDSVPIIKAHAGRLKYWQSQKDGGQSAAINAGMAHATGELVTWLNSDDYFWGDALWTVARACLAHPGHGLYVGNGLRYDQRADTYIPFCNRHLSFNRWALAHGTDFILQPSAFFLRRAWDEAGGVRPDLCWCMDWDIYQRIGERYPVVLIDEFLGVSREWEDTKTSTGKMKRAVEILRTAQSHTGCELTPGALLYLFQTLRDAVDGRLGEELLPLLKEATRTVVNHLDDTYGRGHGFPELSDPQDQIYSPFATPGGPAAPCPPGAPTISLVVPDLGRPDDLRATLESLQYQEYPTLEMVVMKPEPGEPWPRAVNRGLARARGEVLGWLKPGDLLSAGALRAAGRFFADHPDVDLTFGNVVYVDEQGRPAMVSHGHHRSRFCIGRFEPPEHLSAHGAYLYHVPQPTILFRQRLLRQRGGLEESLQELADFELFHCYAKHGKVKKLERTQALYRVRPADGGRRWNHLTAELYAHSRRFWPFPWQRGFRGIIKEYTGGYMRRKFGDGKRDLVFWTRALLVALSAATGAGNPERWWADHFPLPPHELPPLRLPWPNFRTHPPLPAAAKPAAGSPLRRSA